MKKRIVSDSGVNIRTLDRQTDFVTVPLKISTDEKEFVDDINLDVQEMVSYMKEYKGRSGTACPSVTDWLESFGDAEEIICFTITSELSGSYNAACIAKEDYEAEHPERQVLIVDTLSAGPEMLLLVEKTEELIAQQADFDVICDALVKYKQRTGLMFSLESLKNLANNGRVSPMVAKFADVLGIHVVGRASEKGDLEPTDKCRGMKKALKKILERMREVGYEGGKVRIDHCNNAESAGMLKQQILDKYATADVVIGQTYGLCSFYAECGGLMIGFEKSK